MEIRWVASSSASCLYAASLLAQQRPVVDARLTEALMPAVESMTAFAQATGLSPQRLCSYLLPLAAGNDNNLQLATTVSLKLLGPAHASTHAPALAREIAQLEAAYARANTGGADELSLRGQPLREQWEARGPGFIKALAALTDKQLLTENAQVVLVQPVRGGGGQSFPPFNTVLFEAVLANPFPDLPEVVRLGWLLAQLNLDLPDYQGELPRDRAFELGAVALLPPALEAAADVEWCSAGQQLLSRAVELWKVPVQAAVLSDWWETYKSSNTGWAAALGALDRMLTSGL